MVDAIKIGAGPIAARTGAPLVREGLKDRERLGELLFVIVDSLKVPGLSKILDLEHTQRKLFVSLLSLNFTPEKNGYVFIDPAYPLPGETQPPEILSRVDVITLLMDIARLLRNEREFNQYYENLNPELREQFNRILLGIDPETDISIVRQRATELREIFLALAPGKEGAVEEKTGAEILRNMPAEWLQKLNDNVTALSSLSDLFTLVSVFLSTHEDSDRVEVPPSSAKINPIGVREFINDWLIKFYSENRNQPPYKQRPVVEPPPFLYTTKHRPGIITIDDEKVTALDHEILAQIQQLLDAINAFVEEAQPPVYATATADQNEGGETDLTKNPDDEKLDSLILQFSNARSSYKLESARLRAILLPQFFHLHGFGQNLDQLEVVDQADFKFIEREFQLELESVLRSLSKEDFDNLAAGQTVNFRLKVIRLLYGRLATNPRFVAYMEAYKATYLVKHAGQAEKIDSVVNADDAAFNQTLETQEQNGTNGDWAAQYVDQIKAGDPSSFLTLLYDPRVNLKTASYGDFVNLFSHVLGQKVDETLLFHIDIIVASQWSPERLFLITADQFPIVFGFKAPAYFFDNSDKGKLAFRNFITLCAEYMEYRRRNLAAAAETDAIGRTKDAEDTGINDSELNDLQTKRALAEKYPSGGRALILASGADRSRVEQYVYYGHEDSDVIGALHREIEQSRVNNLMNLDLQARRELLLNLQFIEREEILRGARANQLINNLVAATSEMEGASGFVTNADGSIRRNGVAQSGSVFKKGLQAKRSVDSLRKKFDVAKKAAKATGEVLDLTGRAVTLPLTGGIPLPKPVRQLIGLITIGAVVTAIAKLSEFLSSIGGQIYTFLSGGGSSLLGGSSTLSPLAHRLGYNLNSASAPGAAVAQTPAALAKAGAAAPSLPSASQFGKALQSISSHLLGSYGPYLATTLTIAGTAIYINATQLSAFLPPSPTLGTGDQESPYVTITKTADPGTSFATPQTIKYTITIKPKPGYTLEVNNLTDTFSFNGNKDLRKNEADPPLPTSPINLDALKAKKGGSGTITDADTITLDSYSESFDGKFHDATVINTVELTFKASGNGTMPTSDSVKAHTHVDICFGTCPKPKSGCWPTTGSITQLPFGSFDHGANGEDAYDIGAAIGTPVYAPYDGIACAAWNDGYYDTGVGGYGNVIYLFASDGNSSFMMTFGHLNGFASGITPHSCADSGIGVVNSSSGGQSVKAGDVIGFVGSTGNSSGPHLHYQVGPERQADHTSKLVNMVPDPSAVVGTHVMSCYDGNK